MFIPFKRILALSLCLVLALGILPAAGAEGAPQATEETLAPTESLPEETQLPQPESTGDPEDAAAEEAPQPAGQPLSETAKPEEQEETPPSQEPEETTLAPDPSQPEFSERVSTAQPGENLPEETEPEETEPEETEPEETESEETEPEETEPEETQDFLSVGGTYPVTVLSDKGFPMDAELSVRVLSEDAAAYIHENLLALDPDKTGIALDLTLYRQGAPWFPEGDTLTVTVDGLGDLTDTAVYHLPDFHGDRTEAAVSGARLAAQSAGYAELLPCQTDGGKITFQTDGFSVFYVLKGNTGSSGTENRLVTVNSGTDNTVYAAPGTTISFQRDGYFPHWRLRESGSGGISVSVSGSALGSSWISGKNAQVTVSPDAAIGDRIVLQSGRTAAGRNSGAVTVIVRATEALISSILESDDYPLYLTVIGDSTNIPGEPSVVQGRQWRFLTPNYTGASLTTTTFSHRGQGWIPEKIADFINFTSSVDGTNTMGVADATGSRTLAALAEANTPIDWEKVMEVIWNYTQGAASTVFGDGTVLRDYQQNHSFQDFLREYRVYPYVVKIQTSFSLGWHIDCCIVKRSQVRVNYDLNLPSGAVLGSSSVKTPSGVSVDLGQSVTVDPDNQSGLTLSQAYPVTDGDGKEYRYTFLGWYDNPSGSGQRYLTGDSLQPRQDMTLYACWESSQEIVYRADAIPGDGISGTTGSREYPYNALVEFTAQVMDGWEFEGWYDGEELISADIRYTFRMPRQNVRYEARAVQKTYLLTLEKSGMQPGETALFRASWAGGSVTVALGSGESVTLTGIPAGVTVSVVELSGWSWRYSGQSREIVLTEDSTLSFVNSPKSTPWRWGEDRCRNQFTS